jgi:hypothetical protein
VPGFSKTARETPSKQLKAKVRTELYTVQKPKDAQEAVQMLVVFTSILVLLIALDTLNRKLRLRRFLRPTPQPGKSIYRVPLLFLGPEIVLTSISY